MEPQQQRKMATTSFVEEACALRSELQRLIEVASPTADETQVNGGLLRRIARHLQASITQTETPNTGAATPPAHHDTTEPTPRTILEVVQRIERRLDTDLPPPNGDNSYAAAARRGATAHPAPQQQQLPSRPQPTAPPGASSKLLWSTPGTRIRWRAYGG